jgi:hypothetical protein
LAQVLDNGAHAVSRGAARFASQVLNRGARAGARGAATLIAVRLGRQHRDAAAAEKEQPGRFTVRRLCPSRRCTWPIASRRARQRRRMFEPQLRLRHKTSAWASSGPFRGKTGPLLMP